VIESDPRSGTDSGRAAEASTGAAPAPGSAAQDDGGCCGPEALGVGLIGFGVLVSIAIPVVIFVGWIPVVAGALILRFARRRAADAPRAPAPDDAAKTARDEASP